MIASVKSDGLYSLVLPQDIQAEPQRARSRSFRCDFRWPRGAGDRQLHWRWFIAASQPRGLGPAC